MNILKVVLTGRVLNIIISHLSKITIATVLKVSVVYTNSIDIS